MTIRRIQLYKIDDDKPESASVLPSRKNIATRAENDLWADLFMMAQIKDWLGLSCDLFMI